MIVLLDASVRGVKAVHFIHSANATDVMFTMDSVGRASRAE